MITLTQPGPYRCCFPSRNKEHNADAGAAIPTYESGTLRSHSNFLPIAFSLGLVLQVRVPHMSLRKGKTVAKKNVIDEPAEERTDSGLPCAGIGSLAGN